jgi:hypothetical protein
MGFNTQGWYQKDDGAGYLPGLNYLTRKYGHTSKWWKEMDFAEIRKDFEVIRSLGVKAIRIPMPMTLMPKPGVVDKGILANFAKLLALADEHGFGVIPNPFHTGKIWEIPWMDPSKAYTDPKLFRCYAKVLESVMRPYRNDPRIIAWDICSEAWWMIGKPPSRKVFSDWMVRLIAAAKATGAVQPLIFGFDHSGIVFDVGGDIDLLMDHVDMMVMHSYSRYPIGAFLVDDVNSLRDTYYNSFILRRSAARPMPNGSLEFGNNTLYMNERNQAEHMRVSLHSLLANGSQSFFPWVFTDFEEHLTSYYPGGLGELHFGMVRVDRSLKPAAVELRNFYALLEKIRPAQAQLLPYDAAIYVPDGYYSDLGYWGQAHFNAYCLAKQAGLNAGFTRSKDDWSGYKALIVPGNNIGLDELRKIADFAKNGGAVLFSVSHNRNDAGYIREAMGAVIAEIRKTDDPFELVSVTGQFGLRSDERLNFGGTKLQDRFSFVLESSGAEVLMKDGQGNPALLLNRYGKGVFLTLAHPLEAAVSGMPRAPRTAAAWKPYAALKSAAGIGYPVETDRPEIETACFRTADGFLALFVNHENSSVTAAVRFAKAPSAASDFLTDQPLKAVPAAIDLPASGVRLLRFRDRP